MQRGFTLIEIAIVLVIIGLLMGGVMRGQELITSARVRQLIAQQEGVKASFFGFQDRFRAFPGDFAGASKALRCPSGSSCLNGNGNGVVEESATPLLIDGVASEVAESLLVWMHLASAGFVNGQFSMIAGASGANDDNTPRNPYNSYLQLSYNANYLDAAAPVNRHNLKTGPQVPVDVIAEVDRKIDDGNGLRGAFRYSLYGANAPAAPPAPTAVYEAGQCMATTGLWYIPHGEPNCGGTSLF